MAEEWRITRSTRVCFANETPIEPGEAYYSVLVEVDEPFPFKRRDYSLAAWAEVDKSAFFSYWKSKGREEGGGEKRRPIDYGRVLVFFDELADAVEPGRRLLRYVVALVLARRRVLRIDSLNKTPEGERLELYDRRGPRIIEILAPEAAPTELRAIQEQLNELFDLDEEQ